MRADTQDEASRRVSSDRIDEKSCVELVESVNSIVLRWNSDFIITYMNDYGERFFGYGRGELIGRSVIGTIVPPTSGEDLDMVENMRSIFRHPERYVNNENENLRKDRSRVWVSWTNRAVIDDEGRVGEIISIGNDITPLKKARDALKYQLDKTQMLIDAIPVPVFYKDASGVYTGCNRAFEEFMGLRRDRIVGKTVFDLLPQALADEYHRADEEMRARPGTYGYESIMKYDSRPERDVVITKAPLYNEDGSFGGVIGTYQDITERKRMEKELRRARDELETRVLERTRELRESNERLRMEIGKQRKAEEALRDSEARLHSIFRAAPTGIGLTVNRRIVEVNARLCEMVGYEREELIGQSARILYPTQEEYEFVGREKYRQISDRGTGTVETRWCHKDGHCLDILLSSTPIDPGNISAGVTFTALDITERKRAEEAVRQLTRKDEEALRVAHMGHWEYDVRSGVFVFNDQYYTLHGTTAKEAGGYLMPVDQFVRKYMAPDYAYMVGETLEKAVKTTDPNFVYQMESRILRADGEPRDVIVWFRAEKDTTGRTVKLYGVNQDITERKRAERALEHAKAQAELYVDLMGHDISNMNQAIMGFLELAELAIPMEPGQRELIEKPIEIVNHTARMIDNVRKLERIHQGKYVEKEIDMCALISSVVDEFCTVKDRPVTLNSCVPESCRVIADDILRDVFSNIVDNAIRHTSGAVTIDISVEPLISGGRRYYRTSISDNGPGIPDEQKRRVFTFMQGHQAKPGRRGLGLCLVKTLVEHFNGQVWVENRVPENYRQGAKFVVELPAA
ncbi:PAS domain S-box protein [Methanocella sp. MCL-LM]|uniref:PAS domain S-box protein n=1 Tax=Methanocella sp. MCL-LM TaxID=3412035 RepID=UPI003C71524E